MNASASRSTLRFFVAVAVAATTGGLFAFGTGGFTAQQAQAHSQWQIRSPYTPQLIGANGGNDDDAQHGGDSRIV